MPLDWLRQLSPTMQQQIALQRALLALQREDEQIRARTAEKEPALARGLAGSPGAAVSGGPTYAAREREPAFKGGMEYSPITTAFRPGAGSLEEALRAAKPTEGYVSGEERARLYKEKMAVGKEELAGKASEFWQRIEPLDDKGEKVALDACRKYQPDLYRVMVEQGYVDKTTGVAVKPEVVKKPMTRDTHVEDGWLYEDILYDDGTSTHEIIGRAEEVEAAGPTISEAIELEKLGLKITEHNERHLDRVRDIVGDFPTAGIATITEDGVDRLATKEDEAKWINSANMLLNYYESVSEQLSAGAPTMEEVKAMYEGRPDLISDIQRQLGLAATGVWDETLEEAFKTFGGVE